MIYSFSSEGNKEYVNKYTNFKKQLKKDNFIYVTNFEDLKDNMFSFYVEDMRSKKPGYIVVTVSWGEKIGAKSELKTFIFSNEEIKIKSRPNAIYINKNSNEAWMSNYNRILKSRDAIEIDIKKEYDTLIGTLDDLGFRNAGDLDYKYTYSLSEDRKNDIYIINISAVSHKDDSKKLNMVIEYSPTEALPYVDNLNKVRKELSKIGVSASELYKYAKSYDQIPDILLENDSIDKKYINLISQYVTAITSKDLRKADALAVVEFVVDRINNEQKIKNTLDNIIRHGYNLKLMAMLFNYIQNIPGSAIFERVVNKSVDVHSQFYDIVDILVKHDVLTDNEVNKIKEALSLVAVEEFEQTDSIRLSKELRGQIMSKLVNKGLNKTKAGQLLDFIVTFDIPASSVIEVVNELAIKPEVLKAAVNLIEHFDVKIPNFYYSHKYTKSKPFSIIGDRTGSRSRNRNRNRNFNYNSDYGLHDLEGLTRSAIMSSGISEEYYQYYVIKIYLKYGLIDKETAQDLLDNLNLESYATQDGIPIEDYNAIINKYAGTKNEPLVKRGRSASTYEFDKTKFMEEYINNQFYQEIGELVKEKKAIQKDLQQRGASPIQIADAVRHIDEAIKARSEIDAAEEFLKRKGYQPFEQSLWMPDDFEVGYAREFNGEEVKFLVKSQGGGRFAFTVDINPLQTIPNIISGLTGLFKKFNL